MHGKARSCFTQRQRLARAPQPNHCIGAVPASKPKKALQTLRLQLLISSPSTPDVKGRGACRRCWGTLINFPDFERSLRQTPHGTFFAVLLWTCSGFICLEVGSIAPLSLFAFVRRGLTWCISVSPHVCLLGAQPRVGTWLRSAETKCSGRFGVARTQPTRDG
jgi:hypothetical protein